MQHTQDAQTPQWDHNGRQMPGTAQASTVAVTGSRGLVGSALAPALASAGHRILRLVRGAAPPAAGAPVVRWDPESGALDSSALAGVDAVVHLAGESVAGRWTESKKRRIRSSRVDATRGLAGSLARLERPPRVLVCASAVGYYRDGGDAELDETAPPGDDFLARVCIDWERAAQAAGADGVRTTLLRFGVVFGSEGGALPQMLALFRAGFGGRLGNGKQWFPWIDVEDAVALALAALDDAHWSGPVNAVAPGIVTNAELTRALGRALQRPTLLPVPAFALRLALGELAGQLLDSRRVVPRAAQQRGFTFKYPELEPALRAVLDR